METSQLRYFVSIAEAGSVSAAARRHNIAQPALSQRIKKLEQELGVELFVRSIRGVSLTEGGQTLLEHAYKILNATDAAVRHLQEPAGEPRGQVRVGLPSSVGTILSVPLAETIWHDYPKIRLQIVDGMSGHIRELLCAGSIDIAVLYRVSDLRDFQITPIMMEEMFLVAGADTWHGKIGSNGVAKTPITWADCAKLDLILPSRTHRFHAMLESQGQRRSLSFEPVLEVDSLAEMRDLVIRGSGYTILTRAAAGSAVDQGTLVLVPIVQPALRRMLYFVWDARRVATLSVGTVRRVMKEVTCELVEKGRWQGNLTEDAFAA